MYFKTEKAGLYRRDGTWIQFGSFPQSIKSDNVTVSSTVDSNGYYTGSAGNKYAKVIAKPYGIHRFSNEEKIVAGQTYYFRVEPLSWTIVRENDHSETGYLICNEIIYSLPWGGIRNWLNNDFFQKAFTYEQKQIIRLTITKSQKYVKEKWKRGKFVPIQLENKIVLPAKGDYFDLQETSYFGSRKDTTDYCRAIGIDMVCQIGKGSLGYGYGRANWFLSDGTTITDEGDAGRNVRATTGIVPALHIGFAD